MREIYIGSRSSLKNTDSVKTSAIYYKPYNATKYVQVNIRLIATNKKDKTKDREYRTNEIIHKVDLPDDYQELSNTNHKIHNLEKILDMVDMYYKNM